MLDIIQAEQVPPGDIGLSPDFNRQKCGDKFASEFPLAPSIYTFNLSPCPGSLTVISFCSPWRFTA
jgi:hypothetical protein